MRLRLWMTSVLALVLLSGCAGIEWSDSYCEIAEPHLFGSEATINWLIKNDRDLLVSVVVHNETVSRLCDNLGRAR